MILLEMIGLEVIGLEVIGFTKIIFESTNMFKLIETSNIVNYNILIS